MLFYISPPQVLIADHAHDAEAPASCSRCHYGVHTGQRIALLPDGTWAHTWCAAAAVPDQPRRR
jgi:hypothetical protein